MRLSQSLCERYFEGERGRGSAAKLIAQHLSGSASAGLAKSEFW
jgi:3-hydroxyisobutyrate dehydrogenase-like beta-hydroxyacid dehydrogenase